MEVVQKMYTTPGTIVKHSSLQGAILYQSGGYVTVSEESYGDSKITYSFANPTNIVALIPKFLSENNFLYISIDGEQRLNIGARVSDSERLYHSMTTEALLDKNFLE